MQVLVAYLVKLGMLSKGGSLSSVSQGPNLHNEMSGTELRSQGPYPL